MATRASRSLTPIQIGPWPKGLNNREATYSDRDIQTTELVVCNNFDIKENGVLVSRPGIVTYDRNILFDVTGDSVEVVIQNIIGALRIDGGVDEALVQLIDTVNKNIYIIRTSISQGGNSDFNSWIKQAYLAGAKFFLTSCSRYSDVMYFTTNNNNLGEASTFVGGFKWSTETSSGLSTFIDSGTAGAGDISSYFKWAVDSSNNIYATVPGTIGSNDGKIVKITPAGVVSNYKTGVHFPRRLFIDKATDTMYMSGFNPTGGFISKITSAGVMTTFKTSSSVFYESMVLVPSSGLLIVQERDTVNDTSRLIALDNTGAEVGHWANKSGVGFFNDMFIDSSEHIYGVNTSFIAQTTVGFASDGPPPTAGALVFTWLGTGFNNATNVAIDASDNIWITETQVVGDVKKITMSKTVTTYSSTITNPRGIVVDSTGQLFVHSDNSEVLKVTAPTANFAAITEMPQGDISFILKDRMFIVNKATNRIYYSKATDPTLWTTPDNGGFFDVEPGDGLDINDVAVVNDELFIFKDTKTFIFAFTADPALDGSLRILATDRGAYLAATYNNIIYLVGPQGVQKILNGFFLDLSQQIKALHTKLNSNASIAVSVNKLYIACTDGTVLVMNLLTGAWSTYTLNYFDPGGNPVTTFSVSGRMFNVGFDKLAFFCTNLGFPNGDRIGGIGTDDNLDHENGGLDDVTEYRFLPEYSMQTKHYDFQTPLLWKRMMKFVVDVACNFGKYLFYGNSTINLVAHLAAAGESTIEPTLNVPSSGTDADHLYPIQIVPDLSRSSFRFQNVWFSLDSPYKASNLFGVPQTDGSVAPQLILEKFSAYITQKISQGTGDSATE